MGELLLLSNSTVPGMGFLEHAMEAIHAVLDGRGNILFVPFASIDPDTYTGIMREALAGVGAQVTSLHEAKGAGRPASRRGGGRREHPDR